MKLLILQDIGIYIDEEKSIIVLEYINPAVKNNK